MHFDYHKIHIAGTNGKGSVCRILESVYQQSGYKVGLFTSPHLQRVNERIRIGGDEISDEELSVLIEKLHIRSVRWAEKNGYPSEQPLTYFEMMTAAAIVAFARHEVDLAIFEVGLGGRLDATNLIQPIATAIVSIDFDHTNVLGDDLASIASEKAGIIKDGIPVIVGNVSEEAFRAIRVIADQNNSTIHRYDTDYGLSLNREKTFSWHDSSRILNDLMLNLQGEHQRENAAVALSVISSVIDILPVEDSSIRSGLLSCRNPGRMEWIRPNLLIDCAHNPAGALRLARYLQTLERKLPLTLLLGSSSDKDPRSVALLLSPHVNRILTTQPEQILIIFRTVITMNQFTAEDFRELFLSKNRNVATFIYNTFVLHEKQEIEKERENRAKVMRQIPYEAWGRFYPNDTHFREGSYVFDDDGQVIFVENEKRRTYLEVARGC